MLIMAKRQEYTVVSYISVDGGAPVRFDELDSKTRAKCTERMLGRIGSVLSDYYSAHPEELPDLIAQNGVTVVK